MPPLPSLPGVASTSTPLPAMFPLLGIIQPRRCSHSGVASVPGRSPADRAAWGGHGPLSSGHSMRRPLRPSVLLSWVPVFLLPRSVSSSSHRSNSSSSHGSLSSSSHSHGSSLPPLRYSSLPGCLAMEPHLLDLASVSLGEGWGAGLLEPLQRERLGSRAGELWIPFAPWAGVRDRAPQPAGVSSLWGDCSGRGATGKALDSGAYRSCRFIQPFAQRLIFSPSSVAYENLGFLTRGKVGVLQSMGSQRVE